MNFKVSWTTSQSLPQADQLFLLIVTQLITLVFYSVDISFKIDLGAYQGSDKNYKRRARFYLQHNLNYSVKESVVHSCKSHLTQILTFTCIGGQFAHSELCSLPVSWIRRLYSDRNLLIAYKRETPSHELPRYRRKMSI